MQPQQQGDGVHQPTAPPNPTQSQNEQPSSPASTFSLSQHQEDMAEDEAPSEASKEAPPPPALLNAQKITPAQSHVESTKTLSSTEEQVMLIDSVPSSANEPTQPPTRDVVVEEAGRLTRARSRRARGGSIR